MDLGQAHSQDGRVQRLQHHWPAQPSSPQLWATVKVSIKLLLRAEYELENFSVL